MSLPSSTTVCWPSPPKVLLSCGVSYSQWVVQCSLSCAISRVCTHSGASCRKTNPPTRQCCRYQVKHSKLTEEICLLSEATTYIFPHRNGCMKSSLFYFIYPANSNSRENLGILVKFPCFLSILKLVCCLLYSATGETVETTTDQRN